jgi:hypothetical protein
VYWRAGNSRDFDGFVRDMTGAPLEAGALARRLNRTLDEALGEARESLDRLAGVSEPSGPVELDARLRVVHGNETVAELERSFDNCAEQFARWIDAFPSA